MPRTAMVRPLEPGGADDDAIRRLFRQTVCLGRPLPFAVPGWEAYESLCLDWYLGPGRQHAGLLVVDGLITGYALVCTDAEAQRRWQRRLAAHFSTMAVVRLLGRRVHPDAARFLRLRLRDGWDLWRHSRAPAAAHAHLNLAPASRVTLGGRCLLDHINDQCRSAGVEGWWGEVNARAGHRARALERLGGAVVHRNPNHTLSWLLGEPVERLTVLWRLAPLDGLEAGVEDAVERAAVA